jgi:hypothetical protein
VGIVRNTYVQSVDKMQTYGLLKQVVHTFTSVLLNAVLQVINPSSHVSAHPVGASSSPLGVSEIVIQKIPSCSLLLPNGRRDGQTVDASARDVDAVL